MRVVVIGTSGAGKSTFAAALAQALQLPYIELDRLYWGPGWQPVAAQEFESAVAVAIEGPAWVADGNYLRPVRVQLGLSDGSRTEILGGELQEKDAVVIGLQTNTEAPAASPFVPQRFRKKQ